MRRALRPCYRFLPAVLALLWSTLHVCVTWADWPHQSATNLAVCAALGDQLNPAVASDGAGGMFVLWQDYRTGSTPYLYLSRITARGVPAPGWPADGLAVAPGVHAGDESPVAVADGSGGVIVAWVRQGAPTFTRDVCCLRYRSDGTLAPGWPAGGYVVTDLALEEYDLAIAGDGAGGAYLAWKRVLSGTDWDIYATRVTGAGTLAAGFPTYGTRICYAAEIQSRPAVAADATGGVVVAWQDHRSGSSYDIYAQRLRADGTVAWTTDGVAACTAVGDQSEPAVVTDLSDGAIVAWLDLRSGSQQLYAQRFVSGYTLGGQGVAVRAASAGGVTSFSLASDGVGGAFALWRDTRAGSGDSYVQHLRPELDVSYTADGQALCTSAEDQDAPLAVPDGSGGLLFCWQESSSAFNMDLVAGRMARSGAISWGGCGTHVSDAPFAQRLAAMCSDDQGGALLAWADYRKYFASDLYAQGVDQYGVLGGAAPVMGAVRDVAGDQGGAVRVDWTASWLDDPPASSITEYRVWRSLPTTLAQALLAGAGGREAAASGEYRRGEQPWLRVTETSSGPAWWEYVSTTPASGLSNYSAIVSTATDSSAAGNPNAYFLVQAVEQWSSRFWDSETDSGYSVDNLAPVMPAPFAGTFGGGMTALRWGPNSEPDLAGYRLYRGANPSFTPGPATFVGETAETTWNDVTVSPFFYKLLAVDLHGNVSPAALLSPTGTLAAEHWPAALALAPIYPSPVRGAFTASYSLPRAALVRVELLDVAGRRRALLAEGVREAGRHEVRWDARAMPLAAGSYFVRMSALGESRTRRVVIRH